MCHMMGCNDSSGQHTQSGWAGLCPHPLPSATSLVGKVSQFNFFQCSLTTLRHFDVPWHLHNKNKYRRHRK